MRILCIGDSNTWGYMPESACVMKGGGPGFSRRRFQKMKLSKKAYAGGRPFCFEAAKRERCGIDSLKGILMSHKPLDLVIIMLGSNDLKSAFHTNAKYIASGIKEYIKMIKNPYLWESFAVPAVLVVSPAKLRNVS